MKIDAANISVSHKTSDLGLAATLVSLGYLLAGVDKSNPRKVLFCFSEVPNIDEITNKFWSRTLEVDACTLVENMKLLKGRIYAG